MQSTGDGHCQPLPDGLSIALIEQVSGRAALALEVMKHRLGGQDRTGTNGTIWRRIFKKHWTFYYFKRSSHSQDVFTLTREGWRQQLIRQKLQVFQGDVTNSGYVEETSKCVGILGGKYVEQGHAAV